MCEFNNRSLPKYNKESRKFSQILSQAKFLSELNDNNNEGECIKGIDAVDSKFPFSDSLNSLSLSLATCPLPLDSEQLQMENEQELCEDCLSSLSRGMGNRIQGTGYREQGMEEESDLEDLIEQELEQGQDGIEYTTEEPKVMVYLVGNYMN